MTQGALRVDARMGRHALRRAFSPKPTKWSEAFLEILKTRPGQVTSVKRGSITGRWNALRNTPLSREPT